jgi:hypothetical protein
MMSSPPVQVGDDGSFVAKGLLPGGWRIMVHGPGVFLKTVELGGRAMEGKTMELSAGVSGPLRLVVSTRMASVQCTGVPNRNYMFVEEGPDARFVHRQMASADPQGRIRMPGLPPGKYRIYEAAAAHDQSAVLQEITVAEGGTVTLELKLPKP